VRKKIRPADVAELTKRISTKEVSSTIHLSKMNSSPGEDGIPYEFYKTFSNSLSPILAQAFNEVFADPNLLPQEWKDGVVKLLYKKGDRRSLANWRPITLLKTIYKLYTAVINKRLSMILSRLIHPNQKGFVKGRFILDQVLTVKTVREFNEEGYIAFLDLEKAFDRVNHSLILENFQKLGFPLEFIRVIASILGGTSRIYIRGWFSRDFELKNGVRQGDTISPTLFIIVIETLAENIRKDRICVGLYISSTHRLRILLFADDVCLLPRDRVSLVAMLSHVELYNEANTGKVNKTKSCIVPLDVKEEATSLMHIPMIGWNQMEKYLGCEFYRDRNLNGIPNAIKKLESLLINWKNLHLSIYGKANVLRSYAMPALSYQMSVEMIKPKEEKKITNLLNWFLFSYDNAILNGKNYRSKLATQRLASKEAKGGLNLIPICQYGKAQKINWALRAFQKKSFDGWVHAFNEILEKVKTEELWDIPVEMSCFVPQSLLGEIKRISVRNILLNWFEIPKKFSCSGS
jgi:hypothetical protein